MTRAWAPLIEQTLKRQAYASGCHVSLDASCEISEFCQTQEVSSLDGTSTERLFYVYATLYNLDRCIPASGTFMVPSKLPLGGLSRYANRWSQYHNAYWILDENYMAQAQPFAARQTRVVSNAPTEATLYDPAIVNQAAIVGKVPKRQLGNDSTGIQQTGGAKDSLTEKSKALLQLIKSNGSNGVSTYPQSGNASEAQGSASYIAKPTIDVEALDLAQCKIVIVTLPKPAITLLEPEYLDLALDKVQKEDMPQTLRNVEDGRLGTVKETIEEARAANRAEVNQSSSSTANIATPLVNTPQANVGEVVGQVKKLSKSQKKRIRAAKRKAASRLAAVQRAAAVNTPSSTQNPPLSAPQPCPDDGSQEEAKRAEDAQTDQEPTTSSSPEESSQHSVTTEALPTNQVHLKIDDGAPQDLVPSSVSGYLEQPAAIDTADSYPAPAVGGSDEAVASASTDVTMLQNQCEPSASEEKSAQGISADLDSVLGELPERWEDSEDDELLPDADDHVCGAVNKGNVIHFHLYFAVQHLRPPGFVQIRIVQDADRSLEWFKNLFVGENAGSTRVQGLRKVDEIDDQDDATLVLQDRSVSSPSADQPEFHHLNYLWQKVYEKSATPPEVSLWAALNCRRIIEQFGVPRACSMKAVLITQAWKYVDPWTYSGPEELLRLNFATVRDTVIGLVEKVYAPHGTWRYDRYGKDENVPRSCEVVQSWQTYIAGEAEFYPCFPYQMPSDDDTWVVVKKDMSKTVSGVSNLRYVQNAPDKDESSSDTILPVDPNLDASPELTLGRLISTSDDQQPAEVDQVEADLYNAELDHDEEILAHVDQAEDIEEEESDDESLIGSSLEGSPRKARLRKEEWRDEFLESPERLRNRLSGAENIPGFREPMDELEYPDSEDATELEDEDEDNLSLPGEQLDDGSIFSVDTPEPVALLNDGGDLDTLEAEAVGVEIPEANVPLPVDDSDLSTSPESHNTEPTQISNDDSGLHSSNKDASPSPGKDTPVTPISPASPTNVGEVPDVSSKFFDAEHEQIHVMSDGSPLEIDYEGIPDMMDIQSPIIAVHGSADADAIAGGNDGEVKPSLPPTTEAASPSKIVDASDIVFEANNDLEDGSTEEQPLDAETFSNSDSTELELVELRLFEDYFDTVGQDSATPPKDPTSQDNTLQMVLYDPEPLWSKVLKFCSRLLKRASESMHKRQANNEDSSVPTEQVVPQIDCQNSYLGKSALSIGKQGIKVGKAAIGVGMLPVHAGVFAAKTPFKAARTTWRVGMWAWERVGGGK